MGVPSLRDAPPLLRIRRQAIALDQHYFAEVIRENPDGEQTGHTAANNNRTISSHNSLREKYATGRQADSPLTVTGAQVFYSIAHRRKEIGIRIALDSTIQALTFGITRLMRSLLVGVDPVDFTTYGLMPAVVLPAASIASWLPARKVPRWILWRRCGSSSDLPAGCTGRQRRHAPQIVRRLR